MSHFAKVVDGVVTEVIVASQEEINSERHGDSFLWVQCSYNDKFKQEFPGRGYTYTNDVFGISSPFPSWTCNVAGVWESPVDYPGVGSTENNSESVHYDWDEDTVSWIELTTET